MELSRLSSGGGEAALLRMYLRELEFAADFAPSLEVAINLARSRSATPASAGAIRSLEQEEDIWSRLQMESHAWRPLVSEVLTRFDVAAAAASEELATRTEQAHIGLAALRACFGLLEALPEGQPAPREALDKLCGALLNLVYIVLAHLRSAQAEGVLAATVRSSAASVGEQDAVMPALTALGCASVLADLRRQPLIGLIEGMQRPLIPPPHAASHVPTLLCVSQRLLRPSGALLRWPTR